MKPGYITMTRWQSNNQWSDGKASHLAMTPKIPSENIRWKISRFDFFWYQRRILLSLLVHLKDILKEKCRGIFIKVALFLYDNALAHRAIATQKKMTY